MADINQTNQESSEDAKVREQQPEGPHGQRLNETKIDAEIASRTAEEQAKKHSQKGGEEDKGNELH